MLPDLLVQGAFLFAKCEKIGKLLDFFVKWWYNRDTEITERTVFMKIQSIMACALIGAMTVSMLSGCKNDDPMKGAVVGENSFILTLYPDIAPITCENFQQLVDDGFYNGLTFHRVVDDFIAQGGDPNGDGTGASAKAITGEFHSNGVSNNLSHVRGTVSMARADDFNSATCQFFICLDDLTYLDGQYAAFGNVTEGMEVIDNFLTVPRSVGRMGEVSSPDIPIYIECAETVEADSAGNPRIQFLIRIGDSTETTTAVSLGTTVTETKAPSTETKAAAETESETVSNESVDETVSYESNIDNEEETTDSTDNTDNAETSTAVG